MSTAYLGGPGVGPCDDCMVYALLRPYDYEPFEGGAALPMFLCDGCRDHYIDEEE